MPTPEQVSALLTTGWSVYSYLMSKDIQKLKDGCGCCEDKNTKCIFFLLSGLQYRHDLDVYDTVTEDLYNKLDVMIGSNTIASQQIQWGYFDTDPFGTPLSDLVLQFSGTQVSISPLEELDFTAASYLKYIVYKERVNNPVRAHWKNTDNNFGDIPDTVIRTPEVDGEFRYYLSRAPFVFDSNNYHVIFSV